jgi:hypothetical protein
VNFPQGWPKFATNAFLVTADKESLVHLYLGPFKVSAVLASSTSAIYVVPAILKDSQITR